MTPHPARPRTSSSSARAGAAVAVIALGLLLAGCGGADTPVAAPDASASTAPTATPTDGAAPSPSTSPSRPRPTGSPRPMGHVHGVGRDPVTGDVVLATHGGVFRLEPGGPTPVGPVVDLMGFAIAPDGSYLGSGHPGTETDLPEPVGLIRSTDSGDTWTSLSRGGESDFHGLTAGSGLVAGFDGALRVSEDGRSWTARPVPAAPHVLAASPDGSRLLATTPVGLLSTTDAGRTWDPVATPELLVAVSWGDDDTIAGVGVSGRLVLSEDAGRTWSTGPEALGAVTSIHASRTDDGVEVLAVVDDGVIRTTDLGRTVEKLL